MNKKSFLSTLRQELSLLPKEEIEEIISFYKERFERAKFENKTEQSVLKELESPKAIAANVYEQYKINPEKTLNNKTETQNKFTQIIGILSFDIFVLSWLLPTLFAMVISIFAPVAVVLTIPLLFIKFSIIEAILIGLLFIGIAALLIAIGNLFLKLSAFLIKSIINWHKDVFAPNISKNNKANTKIKNINKNWWVKNKVLIVCAIVVLIITTTSLLAMDSTVIRSFSGQRQHTINYEPQDLTSIMTDGYNINLDIDSANVKFESVNDNNLNIEYKYEKKNNFSYEIDETTKTINFVQDENTKWFEYIFDFNLSDIITIQIPTSFVINDLNIIGNSSSFDLNSITSNNINITLDAGSIDMNSINTDDLTVSLTVGSLNIVNTVVTNTITSDITIGSIKMDNIESNTVNAKVIIGDISILNSGYNTPIALIDVSVTIGEIEVNDVYYNQVNHSIHGIGDSNINPSL